MTCVERDSFRSSCFALSTEPKWGHHGMSETGAFGRDAETDGTFDDVLNSRRLEVDAGLVSDEEESFRDELTVVLEENLRRAITEALDEELFGDPRSRARMR